MIAFEVVNDGFHQHHHYHIYHCSHEHTEAWAPIQYKDMALPV